jgi:hypothetical protein
MAILVQPHAELAVCWKSGSRTVEAFGTVTDNSKIMTFKLVINLIGLDNLMEYKLDLFVLTKTKEMICYCKTFGYGGKMLSTPFLTF